MNRVRIRDLALVAMAGGLLAFEVTSLKGAVPGAMRAVVEQGVLGDVKGASKDAARATASLLRGAGSATTHAALGAVKGAARLLGTVTPPVPTRGLVLAASGAGSRGTVAHVHVVTLSREACRELAASGSARRVRGLCHELETARRRSTL